MNIRVTQQVTELLDKLNSLGLDETVIVDRIINSDNPQLHLELGSIATADIYCKDVPILFTLGSLFVNSVPYLRALMFDSLETEGDISQWRDAFQVIFNQLIEENRQLREELASLIKEKQ